MKEMTCIRCPVGCNLHIYQKSEEIIVEGNKCAKGEEYGKEEILSPKRIVTAVVKTNSKKHPVIPVKTDGSIAKEKINDLLEIIYKSEVSLPVSAGSVVVDNYHGVRVITTREFL